MSIMSFESGENSPPEKLTGCRVPKGFEERYQILHNTAQIGTGKALFKRVDGLLCDNNPLDAAFLLHCQEDSLAADPENNLSAVARRRLQMLSEEVRQGILNACRNGRFGFVRQKLRTNDLFAEENWITIPSPD